jgi:hypothetical protein
MLPSIAGGAPYTETAPTAEIADSPEPVQVVVHQKYVSAESALVEYVLLVAPGISVPGGVFVELDDHW